MNSQKRNNLLVTGPILCNFVTRRLFAIKKGFAAVLATTGPKFCLLVSQNKDNHNEYICYNLLVCIIFLCNKSFIDKAFVSLFNNAEKELGRYTAFLLSGLESSATIGVYVQ